jgi:tetratricopeptide (TPR) repeat protein
MQRGNLPRARIVLRRSLRAALRNELPERTASAYHNLFAVEATAGDWEKAEKFAQLALRWYPPNARGVPRLARDLAFRWIQRGYFDRALPLAKEALHHFSAQADRALVWSDIARAAAASGEAETFEDAWARAWVLVREGHVEPFGADILLNLAHGAASQGDTTRARLAAERALELGRATKEAQILFEAESVLDSLREPVRTMQATETVSESSQLLANKFVRLLSRTRAAA